MIKRNIIPAICIALGAALLLAAGVTVVLGQLHRQSVSDQAEQILEALEQRLPPVQDLIPEERGNNIMGSMQISGVNVIAILEVESHGYIMPVLSGWNVMNVESIPCRFTGSVYDGSLIIGAGGGEGQFDFASTIREGTQIRLTDMEGGRYTFSVTDIDRAAHADLDTLREEDDDLTVFVRDSSAMEYIIIRCRTS